MIQALFIHDYSATTAFEGPEVRIYSRAVIDVID